MIIIANQPVTAEEINKDLLDGGIEEKIVNMLSKSNTKYYYDSLDQLKFELAVRKETVQAAKDLNRSNMSFAIFRKSKCNPRYWRRTQEGGFILKDGVRPSEAINDIFVNGSQYATECATAMIIVYYKALLEVFGPAAFDRIFPKIHLMNWHYIDPLLEEVGDMERAKDYLPGDRRYFMNPDVDPETPEWQGENVIDLGNGLYYGHGIGIYDAKTIIRELNQNRRRGADDSAYLMDAAGRPDYKNLYRVYQRNVTARL